jgi:hypothetical protein
MALIDRLQVGFTGGTIGSGVATHYAVAGMDHQEDFAAFWNTMKGTMPSGVFINVPTEGDTIEVETGQLQSVWSGGVAANYNGAANTPYAAGVGACVTWLTAGIVNGHKVRGRTFVVPLLSSAYDTDGTIASDWLSNIRGAASALIAACGEDFVIYHRAVDGDGGSAHPVVGYRVADRVATLKSRR